MCLGFNEVVAPHVIAVFRSKPDTGTIIKPETASGFVFPGNFKPLAAPNALHTIRTDIPSGIFEQLRNAAIAIAAIFGR
jgi:hypothetical protein